MFKNLEEINSRPEPFQYYTADLLWTDKHTSEQMLTFHLNESVDLSSRNINFIDRSVEWIVSHFGIDENTKIADFGCGPGLYTTRLAEKKADVTGIDFSENSVRYAKGVATQKGLHINYINENYLTFETEKRFDLIMMIMCDFCALSPGQRKTMIRKFYKLLAPGGSVLLDVYSLNAFNRKKEAAIYERNLLNGFWSSENYYGFMNTFKYEEEKVILDKYTIIEKSRTCVVYNWLQYFSQESLRREFEENGFKIERIFSDVAGKAFSPKSLEMAIVAKRGA
ncbi:methyltransferase domain-containing protein [Desulfococcaceae bacterium HSG8]|nr:methyltransferase domain-containing protein [Desulfococcaceae bacterium HSG8]